MFQKSENPISGLFLRKKEKLGIASLFFSGICRPARTTEREGEFNSKIM